MKCAAQVEGTQQSEDESARQKAREEGESKRYEQKGRGREEELWRRDERKETSSFDDKNIEHDA